MRFSQHGLPYKWTGKRLGRRRVHASPSSSRGLLAPFGFVSQLRSSLDTNQQNWVRSEKTVAPAEIGFVSHGGVVVSRWQNWVRSVKSTQPEGVGFVSPRRRPAALFSKLGSFRKRRGARRPNWLRFAGILRSTPYRVARGRRGELGSFRKKHLRPLSPRQSPAL
jgi:hypothetical protein